MSTKAKVLTGIGIAALVLVAGSLAAVALRPVEVPVSEAEPQTEFTFGTPEPTYEPATLDPLPEDPYVLVLGDSWAEGYGSDTGKGFAEWALDELDLRYNVQGIGGTGYLNPGPLNQGTYLDRLNGFGELPEGEPDLVIVQGSINDTRENLSDLEPAAHELWGAIGQKYPGAQILVLTPFSPIYPYDVSLLGVKRILERSALEDGIPYIIPTDHDWTSADNVDEIINPELAHPNEGGYEFLGARFAEQLRPMIESAG